MIDTDTRQLKRDSEGRYYTGASKVICSHCGDSATCIAADPAVNRCDIFLPVLTFNDDAGLDHIANTVRIGAAWPRRLDLKQTVALYNVKTREVFGRAQVIAMDTGPIADILRDHAHANHLMLTTPALEAPDKLYAWQRQQYGPRIVNEETKLTVIYLLRDHSEASAADLQG